ncbi:MAG: hypothetical protein E7317_06400 [Clostridiales bacterium]|nr:hypothetical protein [Clostridiales bacterium]
MQNQDQLRDYFSRLSGMLPELYNIAYAICGSAEQAEYVLESALLEGWLHGVRRGGFREGMKGLVTRLAMQGAGPDPDGAVWEGLPHSDNPALEELNAEPLPIQRAALLRHGCELDPREIARVTGMSRAEVGDALSRVKYLEGRADGQLYRALRKAMSHQSPGMPPVESLYRTLRAEVMEAKPSRHVFSKALGGVLAAALVLLAAAVFWLTAVLIQPETADLPQGEAVLQTVE